ncbi:SIR2 family protein [Bradyrhizobium embrapense]|uniref:SIR2 family protein n=1 Tax=Bradyrhizobium embrapense TaxID=630921 RepID=UPI00067CA3C9|nr:SIR2 family protein [Bradyrhizobium embrapense]
MIRQSETPEALALLGRLIADRATNPARHLARICVFLGAGADLSSGGLTFWELKRQALVEFGKRRLFDVTPSTNIEAEFEALFAQQAPDDKALLIDWLFHRMQPLQPSDAYKLLVLLAESGGIDAIITTNFDGMLEKAQQELGRDLFQIYAPGIARPYFLANERFQPPRKPYLKLHGDIASRSLMFLTTEEIQAPPYDPSMLELLGEILRTHDLVFVGYGGNDPALAEIIADAVRGTSSRIFWCGPTRPAPESPLVTLLGSRMRQVRGKFDDLMMEIARPVLERPSLQMIEPTYLRCLFEWRLDYCNRQYLQAYAVRDGTSLVETFARRPRAEDQVRLFLRSNRVLTLVSGPSGFGKTTLGIRLHSSWEGDPASRLLLIRARALQGVGDIEQYVAEQLGGLGSRGPFSLFRFEKWLAESQQRLVLYIDGINEFSPDLTRCVQLFRNILRFCYFLPETDSAIRVIATIRQETWNAMLSHIDLLQLQKTLWTETAADQGVGTIACGEFTDDELRDAVARLRDRGYATVETEQLSPTVFNQLHDPYLFGAVADASHRGMSAIPGARIYQQALDQKLVRRGSLIDTTTLKDVLATLALGTLTRQQDRFREIDIEPPTLRGEIIRLMKDLHVFVDAGDGYLQFDHDRTLEFFLALGLGSGRGPSLETVDDLLRYLKSFRTQAKPIAAARLYFELLPQKRFATIDKILRSLDERVGQYGLADREMLFGFGREVLSDMAEQADPVALQYLLDLSSAAGQGNIGPSLLRTAVQFGAALAVSDAIQILTNISDSVSSPVAIEANIYATDRLVKLYLEAGCPPVLLTKHQPYAAFFGDERCSSWQRLGRLLGFAAHLGPDNTHPNEYAGTLHSLDASLDILLKDQWAEADADAIADHIRKYCDRLIFNAPLEAVEQFFAHQDRSEFTSILARLGVGEVLTADQFDRLQPYTQTLNTEIEYHLCHLLLAISSFNDFGVTLDLIKSRLSAISRSSSPIEIDFLHAALVYLHVLHNAPYDIEVFAEYEARILEDWPDVLLFRPGLERGERRGFQDLFDRIFEDGFGVIYPYGVLSPSLRRQRYLYGDYVREMRSETESPLPLYTRHLESFLAAGRIEEAIQLLQALAGVIVLWPTEGLLALRSVIGHPDPRIRRAVVRVLAECFSRHPAETLSFLRSSGAAVSEEDLIEIKIRQDAHIGRRQINEEEWARIGHFLLSRSGGLSLLVECTMELLQARSLDDAVRAVLYRLGLLAAR